MADWIIDALLFALAAYFFWQAVKAHLDIRRDRAALKEDRP